jgi:hypothetical protein
MTLIALIAQLFRLPTAAAPRQATAERQATACRERLRQHHLAGWRSNLGM